MPLSLLQSQLETLEVPDREGSKVIICNCTDPVKWVESVQRSRGHYELLKKTHHGPTLGQCQSRHHHQ